MKLVNVLLRRNTFNSISDVLLRRYNLIFQDLTFHYSLTHIYIPFLLEQFLMKLTYTNAT